MMTPRELEREIHALPPQEKAKIVQSLFRELTGTWPGIEKTPGVMGGDACIVRTRIPVWALVSIKLDLEQLFQRPVDIVRYRQQMSSFLKQRIDQEALYV